jgi:hypothetical protein
MGILWPEFALHLISRSRGLILLDVANLLKGGFKA